MAQLGQGKNVVFTENVQINELNVVDGIVQTDADGLLRSSVTLPNGTLATTQSQRDNSTKLATTEYVDTIASKVIVNIKSDNYELVVLDSYTIIEFANDADPYTCTFPADTTSIVIGAWGEIRKTGYGDISLTKAGSVVFRSAFGDVNLKLASGVGSSAFWEKTAANTFLISGSVIEA